MDAWMAFVSIIAIVAIVVIAGGIIAFLGHMIIGVFDKDRQTTSTKTETLDYSQYKQLDNANSKINEYDFSTINLAKAQKEKEEVQTFAQKYGVDVICILTVEPKERVRKIACCAGGFIYLISPFNSPTSKQEDLQNLKETIKEIKKVTNTPLVLGFGTPSSNDIKIAKELSQGLVVGSKIVRIIAQYGKNASEKIYEYVKTLKDAL